MTVDEVGSSSVWTKEQDKAFENAMVSYPEDDSDRWEKIAADVPGKSLEEIKQHYELLVDDVNRIESGCVPLPSYNSSSDGSMSHDEGTGNGKKGGHYGHNNSESNHGNKSSRSDQERRKGIAWTEDEHNFVAHLGFIHLNLSSIVKSKLLKGKRVSFLSLLFNGRFCKTSTLIFNQAPSLSL